MKESNMLTIPTADQTNTVTLLSETGTAGSIHVHNHQYFALQQPPDQNVLQHASLQGPASNLVSSHPVISIGICGFIIGVGLSVGLLASDASRMSGGYSLAALGTIGSLYAAYSACNGITGCLNICGTAFKVIGFGATVGAVSFCA